MTTSKRQSLEAKFLYLTIGLLFIVVLALGHFSLKFQRQALLDEKHDAFETVTQLLSVALQPSLENNSLELSEQLANQLRKSNADLEYFILSDGQGKTLFAASKRKPVTQEQRDLLGDSARRVMSYALSVTGLNTDEIYRTSIPVRLAGDDAGNLNVGFSMRGVNETLEGLQQTLLACFAVAMIVGIFVTLALAKNLTSGIGALYTGAEKVMGGDLKVQVEVKSQDEIGELARMFNRMVVQLGEDKAKLERRANTDSLTGLYNHRFFQERVAEEIKRAQRHSRPISIIMLDLDHFKNFNDTHGHPAGDGALVAVSNLIKQTVREIDVVGRYGGEEFAVLMPECDLEDALQTAERLRINIQRHCFQGKDGEIVPMTASLGVAAFPNHSQEREGLIFAADIALYQSKTLGRNKVTTYTGSGASEKEDAPYQFSVALHATDISTLESLAEAIDAKHGHPRGFSRHVAELAVKLGKEVGLTPEDLNSLKLASLLRDIGQIAIPDSILHKKGPLTEDERRSLEAHPSLGHALVERNPKHQNMLPGILHHHEWWDGSGYPFGLVGDRIPISARIVAVADAYMAMTVDRPHRKSMTKPEAREELLRYAGTQFDPQLVAILMQMEDTPLKEAA